MSHVVSIRLKDDQMERLRRMARRLGRTPSETSVMMLEESLRASEFAFIEFRDTSVGRQAYIKSTRVAVWMVVDIVRNNDGDLEAAARYLDWPVIRIQAAMNYAGAFSEEIEYAIADATVTFEELKRRIPNLEHAFRDA